MIGGFDTKKLFDTEKLYDPTQYPRTPKKIVFRELIDNESKMMHIENIWDYDNYLGIELWMMIGWVKEGIFK